VKSARLMGVVDSDWLAWEQKQGGL